MSRIGNSPINIPEGVTVNITGVSVEVVGPKGSLSRQLPNGLSAQVLDSTIVVKRKNDQSKIKALHGLFRSLLANMVVGVSSGWSKKLELVGVGFRAAGGGDKLTLNIGFSHPVEISAPEGVSFTVSDNTKLEVAGIDKEKVGQVAASIREIKKPDVYKGKGIRYEGEYVRKKAGKAGKAATGAK